MTFPRDVGTQLEVVGLVLVLIESLSKVPVRLKPYPPCSRLDGRSSEPACLRVEHCDIGIV